MLQNSERDMLRDLEKSGLIWRMDSTRKKRLLSLARGFLKDEEMAHRNGRNEVAAAHRMAFTSLLLAANCVERGDDVDLAGIFCSHTLPCSPDLAHTLQACLWRSPQEGYGGRRSVQERCHGLAGKDGARNGHSLLER